MEDESCSGIWVRFEVIDTGIVIPRDRMDNLFKSFSRADDSATRKFEGAGLGLAISKMSAEMMGGQIGIESAEGKGTTIWFTAMFEKQPADTKAALLPPMDISGKRDLLVDDNATNCVLRRKQLSSWLYVPDGTPHEGSPLARHSTTEDGKRRVRVFVAEENIIN